MSTFALDVGASTADVIDAVNYAIANLGPGSTIGTGDGVLIANTTPGPGNGQVTTTTTNAAGYSTTNIVSYLYQYMDVMYANSITGSSGFTSNCTMANYYGLRNTANTTVSMNPTDYAWYQVTGGFGTTKSLFYQTLGGRQIFITVATSRPGYYFASPTDAVAINLDNVTTVQAIYNATVYQRANTQPATPTGGTYNFGNLFLDAPVGWQANVPDMDDNVFLYGSQNTFLSSQAFVNPPSTVWTTPAAFFANGAPGAPGPQGPQGNTGPAGANGISSYGYTVYARGNTTPATPVTNTGSWNFTTGVGVPPADPLAVYNPYTYVLPSTITISNPYPASVIVDTRTVTTSNVDIPLVSNVYHTVYANTYTVGNIVSTYGHYTESFNYASTGNVYQNTLTVTGNTAYVDILLVGAGGDGDNNTSNVAFAGGGAGSVLVASNVALPVGSYTLAHGAGASTALFGTGISTYVAAFGTPGYTNSTNLQRAGNGAALSYNGVTTAGNVSYPQTISGNLNVYRATPVNGGTGVQSPFEEIDWVGAIPTSYVWANGDPYSGANVRYFGGGGGSPTYELGPSGYPLATRSVGGLGGGGLGQITDATTGYNLYAWSANIGTGGGGGGGSEDPGFPLNKHMIPSTFFPGAIDLNDNNSFGSPGVIVIRQHQPVNPGTITYWSNVIPSGTTNLYSTFTNANISGNVGTATNLVWSPPGMISGAQGSRGFIPMAYVATASDPTFYTTTQYTTAFASPRTNTIPPDAAIGTGYAPITGDVAQFVYTPTNTIVVKTFNGDTNTWSDVDGQVISGNVFVTGSINSTALNANDVYTLTLRGGLGVPGDFNSPGFWMDSTSGNARLAGNTSIGNSLTVGANAAIGNNLTIGNNVVVGGNLNVAGLITQGNLQANTVSTIQIINGSVVGTKIAPYTITGNLVAANTIQGNSIVAGSITATQLEANLLVVGNITSFGATLGNVNSPGYWLEYDNGSAHFGGNVTIGDNLTVGNVISSSVLNANTVSTNVLVINSASETIYATDDPALNVVGWVNGNTNPASPYYYWPQNTRGFGVSGGATIVPATTGDINGSRILVTYQATVSSTAPEYNLVELWKTGSSTYYNNIYNSISRGMNFGAYQAYDVYFASGTNGTVNASLDGGTTWLNYSGFTAGATPTINVGINYTSSANVNFSGQSNYTAIAYTSGASFWDASWLSSPSLTFGSNDPLGWPSNTQSFNIYGATPINSSGTGYTTYRAIVVGSGGEIWYSNGQPNDQSTYSRIIPTVPVLNDLYAVATDRSADNANTTNTLVVIVGSAGMLLRGVVPTTTTPSGSIWTQETTGTTQNLNAVACTTGTSTSSTGGTWCAVGNNGTIITGDATANTWTIQTSPTSVNLTGVAYGNGRWVAVGQNGTVITSTDGITWTVVTLSTPTTRNLHSVAYGPINDRFIIGGENLVMYSSSSSVGTNTFAINNAPDVSSALTRLQYYGSFANVSTVSMPPIAQQIGNAQISGTYTDFSYTSGQTVTYYLVLGSLNSNSVYTTGPSITVTELKR